MKNIKKHVFLNTADILALRRLNLELSDFLQFEERIKCSCIFKCRCKENPLYSQIKSIFAEINSILLDYSKNKSAEISNFNLSMKSLLKKSNDVSLPFLTIESLDFVSNFINFKNA